MKILVAVESQENITFISSIVSKLDQEVLFVKDGLEALKKWEEFVPSILIIDYNLSKMSSLDIIQHIRKFDSENYTYILVMAKEHDVDVLKLIFDAGADDFLSKPYLEQEFVSRIKSGERIVNLFDKQSIVFALSELTETRDKETGQHITRIGKYSNILAKSLKNFPEYSFRITDRFIENITTSSLLHDIGKVGIDDKVLKKPGKYSSKEREKMMKHTQIGFSTIESIQNKYPSIPFLKMAGEIAKWHHEKYDGSGYPDKLKGNDIPLSARIVALADVYDALTSDRVYKNRISHEAAKELIIKETNKHFDPEVVAAFLLIEDQFLKILKLQPITNKKRFLHKQMHL